MTNNTQSKSTGNNLEGKPDKHKLTLRIIVGTMDNDQFKKLEGDERPNIHVTKSQVAKVALDIEQGLDMNDMLFINLKQQERTWEQYQQDENETYKELIEGDNQGKDMYMGILMVKYFAGGAPITQMMVNKENINGYTTQDMVNELFNKDLSKQLGSIHWKDIKPTEKEMRNMRELVLL